MYNTAMSKYIIDFINFSDMIVNMVKMGYVSVSNFRLMRTLINNNCIDFAHLHSYIIKLFNHLYHPDVSYNMLQNVLNSYINSYLMSVFERSVECNFEEVVYSVKLASALGCEFASKLNECVLYSVYDIISYSDDMWLSIELPVKVVDCKKEICDKNLEVSVETADCKKEKCGVSESLEVVDYVKEKSCGINDNLKKRQNIVDEKGFESFILPLQQDYTKSSEGYRLQDAVTLCTQVNSPCDQNDFDEFDYDREFSESTSSLSITFMNTKIEGEKTLGSAYTEMKHDNFLCISDGGSKKNVNLMMLKNCDMSSPNYNLDNYVDNNSNTVPSKSCDKGAGVPLANLKCCSDDKDTDNRDSLVFFDDSNEDESDHSDSDDSIVFDITYEAEAKNDDSFDQDDDCADLMSDEDDLDDSIVFSDEIIHPKHADLMSDEDDLDDSIVFSDEINHPKQISLTFCLTEFCVSPVDSERSDDDDDDWDEDDISVSDSESFDFEMSGDSRFSLSQEKIYTSFTPVSSEGYVNACFEEDDIDTVLSSKSRRLRFINDKWNNAMKEFPCEPHESTRVSFMPFPDLVSVRSFEPDNDGYKYSVYVMDQIRFQNRISAFERMMTPYLTQEHRANVYQRHFQSES